MAEPRDLYAVLGVSRGASDDDIKRAYRKLARKHHPDLHRDDPSAELRFKEISRAYEILSKPEKRALYDELGADAEKINFDPERAEELRAWRRRAEAARAGAGAFPFGLEGFERTREDGQVEDLLGQLFGQRRGASRGAGPRRGRDAEAVLEVGLADAAKGATAAVVVPRRDADGSTRSVQLSVTIPAGVRAGQRLRLAGQGEPGVRGGPAGDLYVRIELAAHPVFRRVGDDLELTLPITVPEALRGASVDVPTLYGTVRLKVPAGAQSGGRLRLRGKGFPNEAGAGDLYVVLALVAPTGGDRACRERLARELDALYEGDVRAELMREAS